jgi:hypothetical protein
MSSYEPRPRCRCIPAEVDRLGGTTNPPLPDESRHPFSLALTARFPIGRRSEVEAYSTGGCMGVRIVALQHSRISHWRRIK